MKVLIVGGNGMRTNDGSKFWELETELADLGHEVELAECLETGRPATKVTIDQVLAADAIICYSYGCASIKKIWHILAETWQTSKRYKRWIIIAGVPDFWMKQFYSSLWHKPSFVDIATCFQVDAIPESCPLQDVPSYLINKQLPEFVFDIDANILCNSLVSLLNPVEKHTSIQNNSNVFQLIIKMFKGTV